MPCDSITTTQIDLSKANADVMANALLSLGLKINEQTATRVYAYGMGTTVEWVAGKGTTIRSSNGSFADMVAPAYSQAALKTAATKYGWNWKQTKANVFEVMRR
jgi:hypothetical protein